MESSSGLDKLLPKALKVKRRRHKQKKADQELLDGERERRLSSTSPLESDDGTGTNSNSIADDDTDDRSFGSYESNAEPALLPIEDEFSSLRPTTLSPHPSQIGYLTTSSPEVQASHFDSETQSRLQSPPPSQRGRSAAASRTASPAPSSLAGDKALPAPILEPPVAANVASPGRRHPVPPKIETANRPQTPTGSEKAGPVIVNTPPTPTESRRSTASSPERRKSLQASSPTSSADGTSGWRNMSTHRRSRSGSINIGPSKLSNITAAPLTPTPENSEATINSSPGSGFFSSIVSAAQNAANNISTNIQNTNLSAINAKKNPIVPKAPASPESPPVAEVETAAETQLDGTMDQKESAVRTLGAGDLSLSHLGFDEPGKAAETPASIKFPDLTDTRARSESAPAGTEVPLHNNVELASEGPGSRPHSLNEPPSGDHTPPQLVDFVDSGKSGLNRSSSIRSAIKPHRKRGSSVTTGGSAIGAAIAAANLSVVNPAGAGGAGGPKLTGFAIASKKRNRDFHSFFKSVPDDDYLIEDYSCAIQREILAHGRLYVSEGHLCFSSNILGWTTTLVMSFDEIVSVEKRSTALVFKNGLMISTLHAKHVFASFTSRDATYDLIVNIWKLGHPTLKSTLNGVQLEGTGGDKTEKVGDGQTMETETQAGSDSEEDSDEEEEFYYEEESPEKPDTQTADTNVVEGDAEKAGVRKASGMTTAGNAADGTKEAGSAPGSAGDFPGPTTHAPTDCGDSDAHFDRVVGDDIIPAPLGKVYTLMFGSPTWMSKWLTENQKCTDLQMEDKKGLSLEHKSRDFSYIKPLNGSIGPRQTKCLVAETVDSLDFEKSANMGSSTQTPDVPSGNIFAVKTKYCLTWGENNATHVLVTCTIEWSGKSWLRSPIEKGAFDGQTQHFKDLFAALKSEVSSRSRAPTVSNGQPKMVLKKRGKKSKAPQSGAGAKEGSVKPKRADKPDWGMLEPVRGILEPLVDIVKPILTGNVMYGLLVGLLVATWFGFGFTPNKSPNPFGADSSMYTPDRLAAYDEMWRREDSELWEWLEERVGLGRLNADTPAPRKKAMEPRTVEEKLRAERLNEREVDEAIRVTEEKLKVLKEVMDKVVPEAGEASEVDDTREGVTT